MKKYEIKIYPDPVLREVPQPVSEIKGSVRQIIKRMSKTLYNSKGIGLAANQVGILERIIIADIGEGLISMINPEILAGFGEDFLEEGCLSVPNKLVNIKRRESVFVRYINESESEKEREFKGLTARVIQHEIDHLNGVLIIDYAPLTQSAKGKQTEITNENRF